MTRPHIACYCLHEGVWSALTVHGESATRLLARFRQAHTGPGHLLEEPAARDWYGRHSELVRHLAQHISGPQRPGGFDG